MYVHHTGADFLAHSPAQLVPVKHRPLESDESLEESAHFSFKIHVWFSPVSLILIHFCCVMLKRRLMGNFSNYLTDFRRSSPGKAKDVFVGHSNIAAPLVCNLILISPLILTFGIQHSEHSRLYCVWIVVSN